MNSPNDMLNEIILCIKYQYPKQLVMMKWEMEIDWWLI